MPSPCPRCGHYFANESIVRNHMSQPLSACRTQFEAVLQSNLLLQQKLRSALTSSAQDLSGTSHLYVETELEDVDPMAGGSLDSDLQMDVDNDSETNLHALPSFTNQPSTATESNISKQDFYTETHPNSSQTCGTDKTFTDLFSEDKFNKERETQPFYPFASKDEWELSSFLLRSKLSMAAIDTFLKLKLVSLSSIFVLYLY